MLNLTHNSTVFRSSSESALNRIFKHEIEARRQDRVQGESGATGDEITGIAVTPDRRTMFVNTQHPGNGDPSLTNFPAPFDGVMIPRDSTLVITRRDGGVIGS